MRAAIAAALALAASGAVALETSQWPPPGVEPRMRELQQVLLSRESTSAQRDAARAELGDLLLSPAGRARARTEHKVERPARAAIEPLPSFVKPDLITEPPPTAGVAQLEVIVPPKPVVIPQTGSAPLPVQRFAIDPRTGNVLHETPGGFIDPRTGQFVPR